MAPRILSCCLAALALAACGAEEPAAPAAEAPGTRLEVRVDPDGDGPEPARRARVACDDTSRTRACRAALRLPPDVFEPVPGDVACTQIYGGPQTATVAGTLDGRPVDARFSRRDGCEIARWEKVAPLLEAAG